MRRQRQEEQDRAGRWTTRKLLHSLNELLDFKTETDVQRQARQARAVVRTSDCPDDLWLRTIRFNVFYCTVSFRLAMSRQPEGVYGCVPARNKGWHLFVLLAIRVDASLYLGW